MTPISIGRIALPFLALTAACGAAFVSGFPRELRLLLNSGSAFVGAVASMTEAYCPSASEPTGGPNLVKAAAS